jgi:hypothetical protein
VEAELSPARRWLRRAGYTLGCLVWLVVMFLPCLGFMLAVRGEFTWQRGEFAQDRLWLIQEIDERGLGYSAARVTRNEEAVDGPICVRTRVRFLMWRGTAEPVEYCECYTAGTHEPAGACP